MADVIMSIIPQFSPLQETLRMFSIQVLVENAVEIQLGVVSFVELSP